MRSSVDRPAHACTVPVSEEHLWELSAEFLAEGLDAGERVMYGENGTADAVLGRLVDDGQPVTRSLESGHLVVLPTQVTRGFAELRTADVLGALDAMIGEALQSFPGVRFLGEVSASMAPDATVDIIECESRYDEVLEGRPARIGCLFDHNRYDAGQIARLRAVHRHELTVPAPMYDDELVRLVSPRPFVARIAGEIDFSNRPMIGRALESAMDAALRAPDPPDEIELDLASLRFVDVTTATTLVHAARNCPPPYRLLLSNARPGVLRVLDRCGAPFAERLRITPHPGPWEGSS